MKKNIEFKYKNDYLFSICLGIIVCLFILLIIIIFQSNISLIKQFILLLLTLIILSLWGIILKRKLEVTHGTFCFNKNDVVYTTLGKAYYIDYKEIEYIMKKNYIDNSYLVSRESLKYIIKIKDSGTFTFKYYDNTLPKAIETLCKKANLTIIED